jgi:hypothetical protein
LPESFELDVPDPVASSQTFSVNQKKGWENRNKEHSPQSAQRGIAATKTQPA